MRVLLDENILYPVLKGLSDAGHEALHIANVPGHLEDDAVLALATRMQAVLVTQDKDFGALVHRDGLSCPSGVVLVRWSGVTAEELLAALLEALKAPLEGEIRRLTKRGANPGNLPA